VDKGKNERPDASSSVALQETPSDTDHDCSGSNTLQNSLRGPGMLLVSVLPAHYAGGGLTMDVDNGYPRGGLDRNPSREFNPLIISSTLVTPGQT